MGSQDPAVTPFRSERFVVCVEVGGERRKIVQVIFSRSDGSIFISFPYYEHHDGLVAVTTLRPGSTTMELAAEGKITSHLVKYAHHPDGRVHFSQDGKVLTQVRKQSVPLDEMNGHCFSVQIQGLDSFAPLDRSQYRARPSVRRTILNFGFQGEEPEAIKLVGGMYSAARLAGGPVVRAEDPQGNEQPAFLVAPALGRSGASRVLMLTCEAIPLLDSGRETVLTLIGGFDNEEVVYDHSIPTSSLALMYPASDIEQLRGSLDSIDLHGMS